MKEAIAKITSIAEAKNMHEMALAMEASAIQNKDPELAADAAELRLRVERRLGQLISMLEKQQAKQ